jgi:uncharacterized protein YgiM (DUF1202 family)
MKKYIVLLSSFLLAACNLNLQYHSTPQAWIDAPLDGMVLPLAAYDIVAHAADQTGITQIEFNVNGAVIGTVAGSGPLFTAHQSWTPAVPGAYLIEARGMNSGGAWSEYAEVKVVVQGEATVPPEPTVSAATPIPTSSQAPTLTATPSVPTLTLIENANCRRGPGQVYDVLTSLLKGQAVPITGKSDDGYWWLVRIPTKELCWISSVTGNSQGNTGIVPVVQAPPTPVQEQGCYVFDPNQQPVCTLPCPAHAQPGGACSP